jgi:hypothetical protein
MHYRKTFTSTIFSIYFRICSAHTTCESCVQSGCTFLVGMDDSVSCVESFLNKEFRLFFHGSCPTSRPTVLPSIVGDLQNRLETLTSMFIFFLYQMSFYLSLSIKLVHMYTIIYHSLSYAHFCFWF